MHINRQRQRKYTQLQSRDKSVDYSRSAVLFPESALPQLFVHEEILAPGASSSAPHSHTQTDEVVYCLRGKIEIKEGTLREFLSPGDSACFTRGGQALHQISNCGENDAHILVVKQRCQDDIIY